jgi:hypothetical protein
VEPILGFQADVQKSFSFVKQEIVCSWGDYGLFSITGDPLLHYLGLQDGPTDPGEIDAEQSSLV